MLEGLDRQAEVGPRAEDLARRAGVEVGLADVGAVGADRVDEVDPVVDEQRHPGAAQRHDDGPAEGDQLVVARRGVAQLHRRDAGPGRRGDGRRHPLRPQRVVSVTR